MNDVKQRLKIAKTRIGALSKASPDVMSGIAKINRATKMEKSFSVAQKELIATALSIVLGCEDCILYHVDNAIRHGADESALIEALEVAIELGGGPAVMHAGKALEVFQTLSKQ